VIALLAVLGRAIPDELRVAGFATPDSESARALDRLHDGFGHDPEPGMVVLATSDRSLTSADERARVTAVAEQIARDPDVARVTTPFGEDGERLLLARDRRSALILANFRDTGEEAAEDGIKRVKDNVDAGGLELLYGGFDVGFLEDNEVIRDDLVKVELIIFPVLALILILVFRGLRAAALPLAVGGLAVAGSFACLQLLSHVLEVSVYSLNLAASLGAGLAVNYGLFMVSRYREEYARCGSAHEAVDATMRSAGRAVMYSGLTVAAACASLLFFPQQFIYSMGLGGMLTALLAAAAALVAVPALLPRVSRGERLVPGRGPEVTGSAAELTQGRWYRFSRWVTRRAVPVAIGSAAVLIVAGIPALRVGWTFLDKTALPPGLESRTVADRIGEDFVPFLEYPISVAIAEPLTPNEGQQLGARLAALPGAGLVTDYERAPDGSGALQVIPRESAYSATTQALIRSMRALDEPITVGGRAADYIDLRASIADRAVPALTWLIATTLLIVFLLTGSVVLAVKALLMNTLTLFAVVGALVVIFQDKVLGIASLIGFTGPAAIETTISVVVIAVTLGLATDYSILLLSRIREEHDRGASNEEAVALGLERSGRVITQAALIVAVSNLALVAGSVYLVEQLAIGIAVGVLVDATIVRALLVPSLMRILGDINWWAPAPLRRAQVWVDARLARNLS
jgi:RND superfamily putative drug exporter